MSGSVLTVADIGEDSMRSLLQRYGLSLEMLPDGGPITASFWGSPEAGIAGTTVFARADTPVHSVLHEAGHIVCMDRRRRRGLVRDAGGDDLEESAVCYLQIILADALDGVGRTRLMVDMDAWGYSFRLGSTARWFAEDADEARAWLVAAGVLTAAGAPTFRLRE